MIINLIKYLTKKTQCANIASDGLNNPGFGDNHDIVIFDDSIMSGVYILYNTSSGEKYMGQSKVCLLNTRHHNFNKLTLGNSMSNIISFNFNNLEVRTTLINDEPYFCLKDTCNALDIKNNRDSVSRLKEDGVATTDVIDKMGRKQQASFINESNLFRLIFQSRKETALEFQDWVFDEVLPTLRKTGSYALTDSRQLCSSPSYLKAPNLPEPLNCLEFIALDPNYTHERECYWCPVICRCSNCPISAMDQVLMKRRYYLDETLKIMNTYPEHSDLLTKILLDMIHTHRPEDEYFNRIIVQTISHRLLRDYRRENEQRKIA